ncbi:MarR family transcriptional regulator [Dyella sp. C11]|uniref:MarR family winged helix-turn-helix transcriptional regulator n=1 Tax=Dyella sp. C11 TaxID=2126991 RepID=UPI0013002BD7|nr:MarR family transcriptional regulator [Dyella sp. C11]
MTSSRKSTTIELADAFLALHHLVRKRVDAAMTAAGLSLSQSKLLALVARLAPCRPSDIATHMGYAPRTVTTALDALEENGWIARTPHPTDRRAQLVSITPQGQTKLDEVQGPKRQAVEQLFGVLSAEEQKQLRELMDRVRDRADD